MRIALDTSPLKSGHSIRGIGYYTHNLMFELKRVARRDNWLLDEVSSKTNKKKLDTYDLIHYPFFDLFFVSLPLIKPTNLVVTVHDIIPLLYPKHYPLGIKGKIGFQIQKFLLRKVDAVITDCKTSKEDIIKYLNYPRERIFPIYIGVKDKFREITNKKLLDKIRVKYKLPNRFVLYVGDVNYNKNLLMLAKACKKINTPLVIVGKQAIEKEVVRKHIENKSWVIFLKKYEGDPSIIRVGFVPSEDLVVIYNLASVYCQPSLYEGFGLSVLEAMASGCPVACSQTPALAEIYREAAFFFDPTDINDIAEKIHTILINTKFRKRLVYNGLKSAKRFSWKKCAEETFAVYNIVKNEHN